MNSESALTLFSLTNSESTRAVGADESTGYLWKRFHWWFPSRQWLSFRWLFLSPQGLWALMNPRITFGKSFGYDFWIGSDSVFADYFWVNRGCGRWGSHTSPVEAVSLIIFESAAPQFALTNSESTGVVAADKSTRHLRKRFRWWFSSRQWLSFRWLILSQQGLWPLMNPCVTCGSSFVDDFWVGTDLVFLDFLWVHRGCERWQNHASPLEGVSLMISESTATKFLMCISESTGAMCTDESTCHLRKRFHWWFSKSATTQFSSSILESTWAVGIKEATRHMWKQIRLWFLIRQWLIFCWLFMGPQGLGALTNPRVTYGRCFGDDF
jgi:hypothetical protein